MIGLAKAAEGRQPHARPPAGTSDNRIKPPGPAVPQPPPFFRARQPEACDMTRSVMCLRLDIVRAALSFGD